MKGYLFIVCGCVLILFFTTIEYTDHLEKQLNEIETKYQEHIETLESKLEMFQKRSIKQSQIIASLTKIHATRVSVTFYCPKAGGINGSADKTASGKKPKPGWTVAVSRDLIEKGFYGRKIDICDVVPGKFRGIHMVHDKMAKIDPYTGRNITNRIDICVGSLKDIPKQGVYHNVLITKVKVY